MLTIEVAKEQETIDKVMGDQRQNMNVNFTEPNRSTARVETHVDPLVKINNLSTSQIK